MKKYKVVFSGEARKDLEGIYAYVKDVSCEENATLVINRLAQKINSLDIFPERSEPFAKDKHNRPLRVTVSGRYRIVYIVKRREKEVLIVRVFSVSQDAVAEI